MNDEPTVEQWKEMYLLLARETNRAVELLIRAQRACEELYLSAGGPEEALPGRWVLGEVIGEPEKTACLKIPGNPA